MKKKILTIFLLISCSFSGYGQLVPVTCSREELYSNRVKSIRVFFTPSGKDKEELVYKEELSESGLPTLRFILSLWDEVTYSRTVTFRYNELDQLEEEVLEERILEFYPRDTQYIEEFGNTPLYQKTLYSYNESGHLASKSIFVSNNPDFDPENKAVQTIRYTWIDGLMVQEKSESPLQNIFNQIYEVNYEYNDQGRLAMKTSKTGTEPGLSQKIVYRYDSLGRLGEEIVTDAALPRNDAHYKYVYNPAGRLEAKYKFDSALGDFEELIVYRYDEHGNAIAGERDRAFTYYDNGLIRTERWTDDISDTEILLTTLYEYYP